MARPKAADPLIAAVIEKLPKPGESFPADKRKTWLQMMDMALATVYGGETLAIVPEARLRHDEPSTAEPSTAEPPAQAKAAPLPPKPAAKPEPVYPFIVAKDGYARNGKTKKRVLASEVTDILYDLRGELGDPREIIWADDSTGINDRDLAISVPL